MQTIETKVHVGENHTLQVQLPTDVPVGEYKVVLVLELLEEAKPEAVQSEQDQDQSDPTMAAAWEKWVAEVEQLPLSPNPTQGDYHQYLIEKYRKQGLEL